MLASVYAYFTTTCRYGEDGHTHEGGTTDYLIQSEELVGLITFQLAQPTNRVFKRMMLFPKNEWH